MPNESHKFKTKLLKSVFNTTPVNYCWYIVEQLQL